jgi:hypothetical protein
VGLEPDIATEPTGESAFSCQTEVNAGSGYLAGPALRPNSRQFTLVRQANPLA